MIMIIGKGAGGVVGFSGINCVCVWVEMKLKMIKKKKKKKFLSFIF